MQLKNEIGMLNTTYKQRIQTEIEKIKEQRIQYEQQYAMEKANKEQEIQLLQTKLMRLRNEVEEATLKNFIQFD